MLYQLAEMAGVWDVNVIRDGLSAKGFLGWEAYFNLEPRGEERADHRAASIAGMIFNMAVDVKARQPYTKWLLKFVEQGGTGKQPTKEQIAKKQFELLNIYARAVADVPIVESKEADKAQSQMLEQVARARAAMKET